MGSEISFKDLEEAGINVEDALHRLLGRPQLLMKMLEEFYKEDFLKKLKMEMRTKDYASAKISVHTLKGVAANLGMEKLVQACNELECLIKADKVHTYKEAYINLENCFYRVMRAIEIVIIQGKK